MNDHHRLHLVCGPVGAGKTSYSHQLAEQSNGIVFSIDQWMAKLFQPDLNPEVDLKTMNPSWFSDRVDRCESMIYETSSYILSAGGVVILDLGFIRQARRDTAYAFASSQNVQAQLHYVTAEQAVRQKRVEQRNAERGQTYAVAITPAMFAFAESMFQAPDGQELASATIVRT
ncbi:AAA family ATPase [Jeongeupia chitinilytica]|uniref:Cell division protein ZipA n=1 Tax=Jeongeupia chitinilytica TaxID=1041641 RepID=A0ABQ3H4U2_9NEIS|nr:ATP-binding protein [Jeongeupia chitinilytica]GHD67016.1 cell division protein ZipA [Jeongeupia chitinilytica]